METVKYKAEAGFSKKKKKIREVTSVQAVDFSHFWPHCNLSLCHPQPLPAQGLRKLWGPGAGGAEIQPGFVVKVTGRRKNENFLVWSLGSKLVLFFSSFLAKFCIFRVLVSQPSLPHWFYY